MADKTSRAVAPPVRMAMIGCGGMARHHLAQILRHQDTTEVVAVCEPSPAAYGLLCEIFEDAGLPPPPNEPDLATLLSTRRGELDAAFIVTPHVYHHDQAAACMEAGLDVLLEKPMVMTAAEACSLIDTRDRTGRLLVVAFNGSLSPQVRTAVNMLRAGELGELISICSVGRWFSVRYGGAPAQHHCGPGRRRVCGGDGLDGQSRTRCRHNGCGHGAPVIGCVCFALRLRRNH